MSLRLVSVGKPRQKGLAEAGREYAARIRRYTKLEEVGVKEERARKGTPTAEILKKEGGRILDRIGATDFVIALDKGGEAVGSEDLAKRLDRLKDTATVGTLIIGGALGLDQTVLDRANWTVSLSAQTYPHELARVMVLEQLYRAQTILRGEPYHK